MADNYTDVTDADFTTGNYNIDTGKNLSAAGVRNALHTKENVANRQVSSTNDTADVLDASSSDSYYPSSKLAGKNFAALRSDKQDKIAAGTANDIVAYSGTTAGKFGTLPRVTTLATSTTSASDENIPTEKAVVAALSGKASSGDVAAKQDKIAAGTANDILTKTTTTGTLSTLTKTTSIRTGSTIDTAPDDTRIPTEKAVADAVAVATNAINGLSFQAVLPIGTILMYDGAAWQDDKTLAGWYACTAANSNLNLTPNLEDKFIKGKGGETTPGANWLALEEENLPGHTHSGETNSDGSHGHRFKFAYSPGDYATLMQATDTLNDKDNSYLSGSANMGNFLWNEAERTSRSSVSTESSAHKHAFTTGSAGDGEKFNNMPAYYAVIYIKRVS
ncbi:putative phage tail collar domain family protein [Candidatus Termititenax aidoneus]|uniref:Phage tail collar domain family protein n=1 Tax=Termititenax aidoneus TaxID=2218524 RepID=A0A388TAL2_TERA1|nr:putative phage tail collar domain family protein [Candidatus Termititenax aidoneus]